MKVLVVDDSSTISTLVGEMLNEIGHQYVVVNNGRLALDFFNNGGHVDLVLLDWNMPEMTGIEFLKYNFEKQITTLPIIMMTTENKPERIKEALRFGASEYIMKPFTPDILKTKLENILGRAA